MFKNCFPKIVPFMIECGKIVQSGKTTDDKMANALCMLATKGYRHTLRICNTNWFSIATAVAQTRLDIMLYIRYLICLAITYQF